MSQASTSSLLIYLQGGARFWGCGGIGYSEIRAIPWTVDTNNMLSPKIFTIPRSKMIKKVHKKIELFSILDYLSINRIAVTSQLK